jgi:hypothetical protein
LGVVDVQTRLLRLVGTLVAFALTAGGGILVPAVAQAQASSTTIIKVDTPTANQPSSTRMMITGWAADPTASESGTGVDRVVAYLGDPEAGGQDLGELTYGQRREDVARLLGDARFTTTGFQLAIELPAGDHTLYVFAHRTGAGRDDGWSVYTTPFSASASIRPDPQAATLLGVDQPLVRTAAPPPPAAGANSRRGSGDFTTSVDINGGNGGGRVTSSRNDPIPLDPIVPGMSTLLEASGLQTADLMDTTGSGVGVSSARTGPYTTGPVTMSGGGNTQCPGPNCPNNANNLTRQLENMPPSMVRDLTGYNIPGVGNNTPCTPGNAAGSCSPQTGSSASAGSPAARSATGTQQPAGPQVTNPMNLPGVTPAVNSGPACMQAGPNGQCLTTAGSQGPLGSTCLRYSGSQCTYYGSPSTPAAAGTGTAAATPNLAGATGCPQMGGNGQCLLTQASNTAGLVSPTTPLTGTAPASSSGVCLQFGAGGVCTRYQ